MKKKVNIIFYLFFCALCAIFLAGCAAVKSAVFPAKKPQAYKGAKAKIALAPFDIKAANVDKEAIIGLREMLSSALLDNGHFRIYENVSASEKEKSANLVIAVTVTEFEPETSGGSSGVGGGGGSGRGPLSGLLGGGANKAHMALEIRIIDASSSEVIAMGRAAAQGVTDNQDDKKSAYAQLALGPGLSIYAKTPMEKAIRICMAEAAAYILGAVPQNYYEN